MSPTSRPGHRTALRILMGLGIVVVALALLVPFLADRHLRGKYEPHLSELRQDVTDNIDFFCEQQELLARDPWFHEPRTLGDAGPLLNAWLPWERHGKPPEGSPLTVPSHLPQRDSDFKDWILSTADVSELDFGWMQQLRGYDHWDYVKETGADPQQPFDYITAPMPDFELLRLWAKFRMLQGMRTGQMLEAARDVRHLAWLAYRTDGLMGGMIATALLGLERDVHAVMPAPPSEWKPMDPLQQRRLRALLVSSVSFSSLVAPVEVGRRARQCGQPVVTRCTALSEATYFVRLFKPLAEEKHAEAYAVFEEEIATAPCPGGIARRIWEQGKMLGNTQEEGSSLGLNERWLRPLPRSYVNDHILGLLLTISTMSMQGLEDLREDLERERTRPAP